MDDEGRTTEAVRGHLQTIRRSTTVRYAGEFRLDADAGEPPYRGRHGLAVAGGPLLRITIEDSEGGSARFLSDCVGLGDAPRR